MSFQLPVLLSLLTAPIRTCNGFVIPRSTHKTPSLKVSLGASSVFDDDDCVDLCDLEEVEKVDMNKLDNQPTIKVSSEEKEIQIEKDRIKLEMKWEMWQAKDDCDLEDVSTCGMRCEECSGKGSTLCRFCGGLGTLSLRPENEMTCIVCDQTGEEVCRKCRGSGWVAQWTLLSNFNPDL